MHVFCNRHVRYKREKRNKTQFHFHIIIIKLANRNVIFYTCRLSSDTDDAKANLHIGWNLKGRHL